MTIIEATAGNTGLGLALIATQKGYPLILVVPNMMSQEKISHLPALGIDIRLTRSDIAKDEPEYYQDYAKRLADETTESLYIDRFSNPANRLAHTESIATELWQQTGGRIDAIVVGAALVALLAGCNSFSVSIHPRSSLFLLNADRLAQWAAG